MTYREVQDIWVRACLYEYDYVEINADVENGGSVSDRVALEYFRAKEDYEFSHEDALDHARARAL